MRKDKKQAVFLRKMGKSYSEISRELRIPKSTLSYWLRDVGMKRILREKLNRRSNEAGLKALLKRNKLQTMEAQKRANVIMEKSAQEIMNLDLEKLRLIGVALYLGEGGKSQNRVDFTNSNPEIIRLIMIFFRQTCKVREEKFRIQLSIHDGKNIPRAKKYWSEITGVPEKQFIKVNLSISKYSKKKRRKKLPFGTIQIRIADVRLFHRIQGWTRGTIQEIDNMPG